MQVKTALGVCLTAQALPVRPLDALFNDTVRRSVKAIHQFLVCFASSGHVHTVAACVYSSTFINTGNFRKFIILNFGRKLPNLQPGLDGSRLLAEKSSSGE